MMLRAALLLVSSLGLVPPSAAQVNGGPCTVTVAGQSVQANADGYFLVQNVPANGSVVRATATCTLAGVTLYGTSEFFRVVQNETFTLQGLEFSPFPPPSLVSLTSTASPPTITDPDGTSQVLSLGLFSDQSSEVLDGLASGSTYVSSNPAILAVDEDGLVHAQPGAIGTVLVTSVNRGVTAVTTVALSPGDPLTRVEGFVHHAGQPVQYAEVSLPGSPGMAVTDGTGHFSIPDVPSSLGPLQVLAEADILGEVLVGYRADLEPVPGGMTDAGIVELTSLRVPLVQARGWPHERTSNNPPPLAIDDDLVTFTWTTEAFTTDPVNHLGVDFGRARSIDRLRLYKDSHNGGNRVGPKNLTIQVTTDTGPLPDRTWTNVSGMSNGFLGAELLVANRVNADGTVVRDVHDSLAGDGWASLEFDLTSATGIRVSFVNLHTSQPWNHYKVHELQVYGKLSP